MTRVLVTGASGFIGRTLCQTLATESVQVRAAVRRSRSLSPSDGRERTGPVQVEEVVVGDLGPPSAWAEALRGVEVVVRLAARVHSAPGYGG